MLVNKRIIVSQFGGPEVLQLISEPLPEPEPGEYRVKVLAAGVSYADLLMREGVHPETKKPPFTPGWDFIGLIDKAGPGVSTFSKGQTVAALPVTGAYTRYICLPENELVAVPAGLEPAEAVSLILNYITGYQMLHRSAKVHRGQRVLIHAAAGGVGTAQLQLGQLAGIEMYGTASQANHDLLRRYGAKPIDYRSVDFVDEIHDLTGNGVDVVFDGIGGKHAWRSYRALRRGGKTITYGLTGNLKNGRLANGSRGRTRGLFIAATQIAITHLFPDHKRINLYSIQNLKRVKPNWFREDLGTLFDLLAQGKIKPIITACFPLEEAHQAHELLAGGVRGKIVLLPR